MRLSPPGQGMRCPQRSSTSPSGLSFLKSHSLVLSLLYLHLSSMKLAKYDFVEDPWVPVRELSLSLLAVLPKLTKLCWSPKCTQVPGFGASLGFDEWLSLGLLRVICYCLGSIFSRKSPLGDYSSFVGPLQQI